MPSPPRSSKSKAKAKAQREESASLGDEAEQSEIEIGGNPDGTFDVDVIVDYKPDKGYLVKWVNYDHDANTWEPVDNFGSMDPIVKFWNRNPHRTDRPPDTFPQSSAGRKSDASKKKSSKTSSSHQKAKEKSAAKTNKRKSVNEEKSRDTDDDENEVMEDVAPAKKPRRSSTYKKKIAPSPSPAQENGRLSVASDSIMSYDATAMEDRMHLNSWEDLITKIETVVEADNGDDLIIYFTTSDDRQAALPSSVVRKKAPQKLITFYETNLRWKESRG